MHDYLTPQLAHERKWVIAVYILQIIGLFLAIHPAFIVGVVINYVREDKVHNTFLAIHHRWQIRTFWYGLLWLGVGIITTPIVIGPLILLINFIWVIYRVIKGLSNVLSNEPVLPYERERDDV